MLSKPSVTLNIPFSLPILCMKCFIKLNDVCLCWGVTLYSFERDKKIYAVSPAVEMLLRGDGEGSATGFKNSDEPSAKYGFMLTFSGHNREFYPGFIFDFVDEAIVLVAIKAV